jgi:hypothetical protein
MLTRPWRSDHTHGASSIWHGPARVIGGTKRKRIHLPLQNADSDSDAYYLLFLGKALLHRITLVGDLKWLLPII